MSTALSVNDREATARQVRMLAEYFNYDLQPHDLRIYVDALRDVPDEHLRAGCRRVILAKTFMPRVAEIRTCIDAALADERRNAAAAGFSYPQAAQPIEPHCSRCGDTGWAVTSERRGLRSVGVTRCACYATNPVLAKQRQPRYAKDEEGGRR